MAVIKGIKGLEVTVEVDRVPATEYDPCDDEDTHPPGDMEFHTPEPGGLLDGRPYVVKYIESKPGKSFQFRVKRAVEFRHQSHHIAYMVKTDTLQLMATHDYNEDKYTPWERVTRDFATGDPKTGYKNNEFSFAELDVDSESHLPLEELKRQRTLSGDLGILRVSFYHMRKGEWHYDQRTRPAAQHLGKIAEKCLKGRSLDTTVKYKTTQTNGTTLKLYSDVFADPLHRPFAVFEFRYRSMDGLIKERIITQPTVRQQVQAMSDKEARRLAQQLLEEREAANLASPPPRAKAENRRGVKREREEEVAMSDEAFLARYKGRRLAGGAFQVDLTND